MNIEKLIKPTTFVKFSNILSLNLFKKIIELKDIYSNTGPGRCYRYIVASNKMPLS